MNALTTRTRVSLQPLCTSIVCVEKRIVAFCGTYARVHRVVNASYASLIVWVDVYESMKTNVGCIVER